MTGKAGGKARMICQSISQKTCLNRLKNQLVGVSCAEYLQVLRILKRNPHIDGPSVWGFFFGWKTIQGSHRENKQQEHEKKEKEKK
jgi:hypothetical protein